MSIILYYAIITVFVSSYWADRKFYNVKQLGEPPTCLQLKAKFSGIITNNNELRQISN